MIILTVCNSISSSSKQSKQSTKAEETLKQKLAAVSLTCNASVVSLGGNAKKPQQLPILFPKPKGFTISENGRDACHITWTYQNGDEELKVKREIGTQTLQGTSGSGKKGIHCVSADSEVQGNPVVSRHAKRKKSAETQTGKITFRISTETQTSNVTKRRRCSRKQIAEAETQCTGVNLSLQSNPSIKYPESCIRDETCTPSTPMDTTNWNDSTVGDSIISDSFSCTSEDPEICAPFNVPLSSIPKPPEFESPEDTSLFPETQISDCQSSNSVAATSTVTVGVGNRFDETAQQLFDFEEFHQETQTDPIIFSSSSVSMLTSSIPDYNDVAQGMLNCFATAETQTHTGISLSPPQWSSSLEAQMSSIHSYGPISIRDEDLLFMLDSNRTGRLSPYETNANSPSFMETMDSETQTATLDDSSFDFLFHSMFPNEME
jgi:hypothetical protein